MGKVMTWVVLGLLVWLAWKMVEVARVKNARAAAARAAARDKAGATDAAGGQGEVTSDGGEPMRRCAQCGVYLPASEAVGAAGHWYCSAEHKALGPPGER